MLKKHIKRELKKVLNYKMKKYKVIAIHKYNKCNMKPRCSFCYQNGVEKSKDTKPRKFWYELIPFLKQLTNQIALGSSGEPFMDIPFVKKFSSLCKKNGLICNVTSNGRLLMDLNDRELKNTLKNITLLSISFDEYKIKTKKDYVLWVEVSDFICILAPRVEEKKNVR